MEILIDLRRSRDLVLLFTSYLFPFCLPSPNILQESQGGIPGSVESISEVHMVLSLGLCKILAKRIFSIIKSHTVMVRASTYRRPASKAIKS